MAVPEADGTQAPMIKRIFIVTLCLCVPAVPCLYDVTSTEPPPLAALFTAANVGNLLAF
jgi:hypothetical protein